MFSFSFSFSFRECFSFAISVVCFAHVGRACMLAFDHCHSPRTGSSTHQRINTHQYINTPTYQHINTATHQHINTSTYQHMWCRKKWEICKKKKDRFFFWKSILFFLWNANLLLFMFYRSRNGTFLTIFDGLKKKTFFCSFFLEIFRISSFFRISQAALKRKLVTGWKSKKCK